MTRRSVRALLVMMLGVVVLAAAGCATTEHAPPRPARIQHIVLFKLHDADEAAALIAENDAMAIAIAGVRSYHCGRHLDTGREMVIGDYDVGMVIGFDTRAHYGAYLEDPHHVSMVNRWRPRLEWLKVYDVIDETE